jgi:hypothetical protein
MLVEKRLKKKEQSKAWQYISAIPGTQEAKARRL